MSLDAGIENANNIRMDALRDCVSSLAAKGTDNSPSKLRCTTAADTLCVIPTAGVATNTATRVVVIGICRNLEVQVSLSQCIMLRLRFSFSPTHKIRKTSSIKITPLDIVWCLSETGYAANLWSNAAAAGIVGTSRALSFTNIVEKADRILGRCCAKHI